MQGAPPGGGAAPPGIGTSGGGGANGAAGRQVLAGRRRLQGGVRLPWVGHGVDLGHAVGQVAEESGAHLGVNALTRDRKRVTSFMHSLKPARYFPSTLGSVLGAAAGQKETDGSPKGPGPEAIACPGRPSRRLLTTRPRNCLWVAGWV